MNKYDYHAACLLLDQPARTAAITGVSLRTARHYSQQRTAPQPVLRLLAVTELSRPLIPEWTGWRFTDNHLHHLEHPATFTAADLLNIGYKLAALNAKLAELKQPAQYTLL